MNTTNWLFDLFLIDIETVPQVPDFNALPEEGRKLFVDKISKTMPENFDNEDAYQKKAGILAEFGKVICITTGFFFKDKAGRICLKIKSIYGDDELLLLQQFLDLVSKVQKLKPTFQFAGHNIREFDVPYICRRAIINQLTLPPSLNLYGAKPWDIRMIDTLQWWRFGDYKNYTALHLLSTILGVPTSKGDIDGSMVQHVYYQENDLKRIVEYCQKDVVAVARVIQRFRNIPWVEDENVIIVE